MEGPPTPEVASKTHHRKPTEAGPPAPPPADYAFKEDHPPLPNKEENDGTECPTKLLTSAEINMLPESQNIPEDHEINFKTIDEIILKNTKDLNDSNVREGDVRLVTGQLKAKIRKRRSDDDDDDYDYASEEAAEVPGLSINEIKNIPPIGSLASDGRSNGDTIDEMFRKMFPSLVEAPPQASAALEGRSAKRADERQDKLYDMDMLLTSEQERDLFDKDGGRKKRAAVKRTYWTDAILPYSFMANTFSNSDKTQIYEAMKEWQKKTCLRFEPYTQELGRRLGHQNRLMFRNGGGCSSYVGMINRGPQPVTLAQGCRYESIVAHELGHAIGLHHEQCRPDRDDFVTINKQNVDRRMLYNFDLYKKSQIDSRGYEYDYYSIMHYGKTAFSINGQITIQPKDTRMTNVIGNAKKLSEDDAGVVKKMYKCRGTTTTITTTTPKPITGCVDRGQYCSYWKNMGQCEVNPGYMTKYCTKTCGKCKGITSCKDENKYCKAWSDAGYCKGVYEAFMTKRCPRSCGTCGTAYGEMAELWGTNMPKDSASGSAPGLLLFSLMALVQAATH